MSFLFKGAEHLRLQVPAISFRGYVIGGLFSKHMKKEFNKFKMFPFWRCKNEQTWCFQSQFGAHQLGSFDHISCDSYVVVSIERLFLSSFTLFMIVTALTSAAEDGAGTSPGENGRLSTETYFTPGGDGGKSSSDKYPDWPSEDCSSSIRLDGPLWLLDWLLDFSLAAICSANFLRTSEASTVVAPFSEALDIPESDSRALLWSGCDCQNPPAKRKTIHHNLHSPETNIAPGNGWLED